MNKEKNKNIFDNFSFNQNNISVKNIISNFGNRIIDIYMHFPEKIIKNNLIEKLDKHLDGKFISIDLEIQSYQGKFNKRSPLRVITKNKDLQTVELIFFHLTEYQIKNYLKLYQTYRVSGKIQNIGHKFQIIHPSKVVHSDNLFHFDLFEPNYELSRKKISKQSFRRIIKNNISYIQSFSYPDEWINKDFKNDDWNSFKNALLEIHIPKNDFETERFEYNRKRLAFDELLSSYLTFNKLKQKYNKKNNIIIKTSHTTSKIIKNLDFNLTKDQKKVLKDINKDLLKKQKMYRLIQGDVGSGKTIVALLTCISFVDNGFQTVLMAPTEILARQHFEYFNHYLAIHGIKVEIITSKSKNKKKIYDKIKIGDINILIGTQSVYNPSIEFSSLGLIIIDEQHKFGVKQRIKLLEKSSHCHTLIMSATPIPRSLSFAMYGEISISDIKTKPVGRKDPVTTIMSKKKLNELLDGIERKIKRKEQVFWILPSIESQVGKESVKTRYEFLEKKFKNKVSLLHGRMSKDEIEFTMRKFKERETMILVSTTVIEVGVNIPSASLMIIEEAEKFGLAQLHQLRGRITRGNIYAHCVLIHNNQLNEISKQRLLILKNNNDGFDIAEKDLSLRGAGDFFGTNQSGLPSWRFFKPHEDQGLINKVKVNSEFLIKNEKANQDKINFLRNVFYRDRDFKNFFSV
ncbi:MAG: ATP-dependent DNA helicase RecG [Alphaproteobacteria bacterium]|tara:strand:+ start:486 stop:2546 length:2061 start_codon:yes stop_codon:yes gene_type:complete